MHGKVTSYQLRGRGAGPPFLFVVPNSDRIISAHAMHMEVPVVSAINDAWEFGFG
jgi:hypothetical protein